MSRTGACLSTQDMQAEFGSSEYQGPSPMPPHVVEIPEFFVPAENSDAGQGLHWYDEQTHG